MRKERPDGRNKLPVRAFCNLFKAVFPGKVTLPASRYSFARHRIICIGENRGSLVLMGVRPPAYTA